MSDLISRQAAIDAMNKMKIYRPLDSDRYVISDCLNTIVNLPSVNPQPKTGHWIEEDMFDGDVAYRCSECNELFWIESGTPKDNGYNFCPKCGKRLVDPQENEDKE